MDDKKYSSYVDKITPNSPTVKNCIKAFVSGGFICVISQFINGIFISKGYTIDQSALLANSVLIVITGILTGLGLFSKIGYFCGAGTFVPITGFANSMVSTSIEFKKEGLIFGLGAKMFTLAGPVVVYGTLTSVLVGIIYYFFGGGSVNV